MSIFNPNRFTRECKMLCHGCYWYDEADDSCFASVDAYHDGLESENL